MKIQHKMAFGIALALLLIAPFGIYPIFLMKLLCFSLFACSFNLLLGFTGLLSFGHAAFFGGAGYMTGYLIQSCGVPSDLALVAGAVMGAFLGLIMGTIAIRRQGIYFSMITLALAQMWYFVCLQSPITGGEDGLQGIVRGKLFGFIDLSSDLNLYYLVLAIAVAGFLFIVRIIHSPFGMVLKAIKDNEPRAISLGYDVNKYKLLVFILSSSLAGLAGATKTLALGFCTLSDVHWSLSGVVILMTLVGGMGTLSGPILGAVLILCIENKLGDIGNWLALVTHVEWFSSLGESVSMVTGLIFIACVLLFRRGIIGEISGRWSLHL